MQNKTYGNKAQTLNDLVANNTTEVAINFLTEQYYSFSYCKKAVEILISYPFSFFLYSLRTFISFPPFFHN
jgi:hypothetical protein